MTFSILGLSADRKQIGIAIQSKFPGVAGNAIFGKASVGVVATQGFSNPVHAQQALSLLEAGFPPKDIAELIERNDADSRQRQLAILDTAGRSHAISGVDLNDLPGECGIDRGENCIAIGNLLRSSEVVKSMTASFEESKGDLTDRLISSLAAGQLAGGEVRGMQAAGVLVFQADAGFQGHGDKLVDISVYDHNDPIDELARCYKLHKLSYHAGKDENLLVIDPSISEVLIGVLKSRGFLDRNDSDKWNQDKNDALENFLGYENYDGRIRNDGRIDREVFDDIVAKHKNL